MRFIITGGMGFIGSAVVRYLIKETKHQVLNLDKLTYAANLESLSTIAENSRYQFVLGDIADSSLITKLLQNYQPHIIMHLAAESHVDRSIDGSNAFIQTNIIGTYNLLESVRKYWCALPDFPLDNNSSDGTVTKQAFRFHHVSTDEVYGSLGEEGLFTEATAYDPSSPYSATKASSDHLVRAWHRTYGIPIVVSNCSNNYGPYQFPEKLIPLMILNVLERKPLPVYGNGQQIRDWLYVDDHVRALYTIATEGKAGETYNIGGNAEKTNLEVVFMICDILQKILESNISVENKVLHELGISYKNLITFVADRPGHDVRYAIDSSKIQKELGWKPIETFESGLYKTVAWYLNNSAWWQPIKSKYAGQRLGSTV